MKTGEDAILSYCRHSGVECLKRNEANSGILSDCKVEKFLLVPMMELDPVCFMDIHSSITTDPKLFSVDF